MIREETIASAIRYELRVLQAIRRIIRGVDLHSRRLAAEHDITGPQLLCLGAIRENEPATATVLARAIHLSPSTVIGILDRLEAKGLIVRERETRDRRIVRVSLTGAGRTLVESSPSPLQDRLATAMRALPETELASMAASLERIVELMEVGHLEAAPILELGPVGPTPNPVEENQHQERE